MSRSLASLKGRSSRGGAATGRPAPGAGRHVRQRLLAQVHHPLHHVAQLAHVARPGVLGQQRARLLRQGAGRAGPSRSSTVSMSSGMSSGRSRSGGSVTRSTASRWNRSLAEPALLHRLLQIHVRGGHHPHVHRAVVIGAHPLHLAPLQHAQQAGLHLQRQLAHLVQEDGAAVGPLEGAGAIRLGAGEGPLHVAEQLRLDERAGRCRPGPR